MHTLSLEAVTLRYPGGAGVGPVTGSWDEGLLHVIGPNGSGKSTLLGVIATSLRRTSGQVLVQGLDPEHHVQARANLGAVPTGPLMPGFFTVDEAWQLMASLRGRPDWNGARLRDAFDLPGSLRLTACSTGMRRKALLLAALAGDPAVLLLDETLANLDAPGLEVVREAVAGGPKLVVLAHHGALPAGWVATATLALPPGGRPLHPS